MKIKLLTQFINYCKNNEIDKVKQALIDEPILIEEVFNKYNSIFTLLCEKGYIELIKWFLDQKPNKDLNNSSWIFFLVCKNSQLEVAKLLVSLFPNIHLIKDNDQLVYDIIKVLHNKNLEIIKFLLELYANIDIFGKHNKILYKACNYNCFNIVKWFFSAKPDNLDESIYLNAIKETVYNTNIDLEQLNWLLELCKQNNINVDIKTCIIEHIGFLNNQSDTVIDWFFSLNPKEITNHEEEFIDACEKGNLKLLKLMYNITPIYEDININTIFIKACKSGNIELLEWVISVYPEINLSIKHINIGNIKNPIFYFYLPLVNVCTSGNIEAVKWLISKITNFDIKNMYWQMFNTAYMSNHLELTKWLYNLNPYNGMLVENYEKETEKEHPFINACKKNNIDFIKWLESITEISNEYYNKGFVLACSYGNLETAQYLVNKNPKLDVSYNNECAFRYACNNSHKNVILWLLEYKPTINIRAGFDFAFNVIFNNSNNYDLADLFVELLPDVYDFTYKKGIVQKHKIKDILPTTNTRINVSNLDRCILCTTNNPIDIQTGCGHNFCKDCFIKTYNYMSYKTSLNQSSYHGKPLIDEDIYSFIEKDIKCPYCKTSIISINKVEII